MSQVHLPLESAEEVRTQNTSIDILIIRTGIYFPL